MELRTDTDLDGVLILEEYRVNGIFFSGLTIGTSGEIEGLILLLTKSPDFDKEDVNIKLGTSAEINGVLLASTQSDPENPHSNSNRIILDLGTSAHINYREDKVNTPELKEKLFDVLNKDYSPN